MGVRTNNCFCSYFYCSILTFQIIELLSCSAFNCFILRYLNQEIFESNLEYFEFFSESRETLWSNSSQASKRCFIVARTVARNELFGNRLRMQSCTPFALKLPIPCWKDIRYPHDPMVCINVKPFSFLRRQVLMQMKSKLFRYFFLNIHMYLSY